jgi:hypothetical protein
MLNLASNGHLISEEINKEKVTIDETTKKQLSVVCNLKQARWEQVSYLSLIGKENLSFSLDWNIFIEKYCL